MKRVTVLALFAFAFQFRLMASDDLAKTFLGTDLDSIPHQESSISPYAVSLSYTNGKSTIDHRETSSSETFFPLGKETSINKNSFTLFFAREFTFTDRFSISFLGRLGAGKGSEKGTILQPPNETIKYEENFSGFHYGLGGTFNYTFKNWGLAIQPFLGGYIINSHNKFELDYSHPKMASSLTTITYDENLVSFVSTAGFRFFDLDSSLFSYFSVDHFRTLSDDSKIKASQKSEPLPVNAIAPVKDRPFFYTLGVGFTF